MIRRLTGVGRQFALLQWGLVLERRPRLKELEQVGSEPRRVDLPHLRAKRNKPQIRDESGS